MSMTDATSDGPIWVAVSAAIVAIISAGGTLWSILRKEKRQDDTQIAKELKSIITRSEKQINRQQVQIDNYDKVFEELKDEHSRCRIQLSDIYGWLLRYYDYLTHQANMIRELGKDPGKLPDLPPHPLEQEDSRESERKIDFMSRTLDQGKEMIEEVDKRQLKPRKQKGKQGEDSDC